MANPKARNASTMSAAELREAGVPYLVERGQLTMLGLDPDQYERWGNACALNRVKDADLIHRLSTMRDQPMSGARN